MLSILSLDKACENNKRSLEKFLWNQKIWLDFEQRSSYLSQWKHSNLMNFFHVLNHTFTMKHSIYQWLMAYPSPVNAQHDCMCHWCFLIDVRSNWRDISAADIAPFKSYNWSDSKKKKFSYRNFTSSGSTKYRVRWIHTSHNIREKQMEKLKIKYWISCSLVY